MRKSSCVASPGAAAAAGVRAPAFGSRAVLDEPDLSAVHLGAVELLQSPLHVRVEPELDHALVPAALVGVGVRHLSCLPHVVLGRSRHKGEVRTRDVLLHLNRCYVSRFVPTFKSCQLQRLERFSTMSR